MFWLKALVSGLLIAAASEVARRYPTIGAMIGALPLVAILAMIWMWRGGADDAAIAGYSRATFWFVLPSLPMFLVMPMLLRSGFGFWPSILAGCALTIGLYGLTIWLLPRLGINV